MSKCIRWLLRLGLFLTALVWLGGYLGRFSWLFDLMAHFREYYILSFALVLAGSLYLRLKTTAVVAFLFLTLIISSVIGFYFPPNTSVNNGVDLTIFVANIKRENRDYQKTIGAIQQQNPDLILLIEPDQAWINEMNVFSESHPYEISEARDDNFGILLLSKIELVDARIEKFGLAQVPTIVATIDGGEERLTVVGTHPYPPFSAENTLFRDDQLLSIAQFIDLQPGPTILVGDFNATPFSSIYQRILREADMKDCGQGSGLHRTWQKNNFIPPIPLAIDHCLATQSINITSFEVGPPINSDHRPLIIKLSLP